jgi:hypothetical protein
MLKANDRAHVRANGRRKVACTSVMAQSKEKAQLEEAHPERSSMSFLFTTYMIQRISSVHNKYPHVYISYDHPKEIFVAKIINTMPTIVASGLR